MGCREESNVTTTKPAWVRNLQIVYGTTLAIWLVGFAYVAYADTQNADAGSWFGASGTLIMAIFGTGPVYLAYKSYRLSKQAPDAQRLSAERIFALQQVAGIPLIGGAVLGLLPAVVNIGSFFVGMTDQDRLTNAGIVVPWTMVYVFAVTHLVVMAIRRGIRARELAETPTASEDNATTRETSVTPKLPIAPNLFLGVAVLLGYFTIDVELRAWEMARNGELTQLESTGPVFSFIQFLDQTIGNFAAIVVIVFGIINWTRDSVTARKLATPLIAAIALAIAPGAIALGLVGVTGLSGDATQRNEKAAISSDWINNLSEGGMPEGFTEVSDLLDCGMENCVDDPDSSVTFVRLGDNPSAASEVCAVSIAYAFDKGATAWATTPDYVEYGLSGSDDPDANAMCVTTLADYPQLNHPHSIQSAVFRIIGTGDIPFQMDLVEIDNGTADAEPDVFNYRLTISTTFQPDELLPGEDLLSQGTHELNDLLTAIGQARLNNPNVDQNDGELIRDALDAYQHDIPVTPIVEANGEIWFLELETSDGGGVMCLSIGPWDAEWEGQPDPGSGYGVSSAETFAQLDEYNRFGEQAWGSCSP